MTRWGKCLALTLALVFLVAINVSAKDAVTFGEPVSAKINANVRTVSIPLNLANTMDLAAIDIPLQFAAKGDAIDLVDVTFDEGRAHYFDVRVANIDNDAKTVIIGLLWMAYNPDQPELGAGEGRLATLTFEVSDDEISEITLTPTTTDNPSHELNFIYNDMVDGRLTVKELRPEFGEATFPLAHGAPIPETWALDQNYPNPFNASTNISFALPIDAQVRLEVFNILGQRVATVRDEFMSAGYHTINWESESAATGVYFYRLKTEEFTETRKMTLLK